MLINFLKFGSNLIRHQPVIVVSALVVLLVMLVSLQQVLSRGYERALNEQKSTNDALIYALEESVVLSLQAVDNALQSLASEVLSRSPQTFESIKTQTLHSLPQLRDIQVVPVVQAQSCMPVDGDIRQGDLRFLEPASGRYWGDASVRKGLSYWPACVPFFIDDVLEGFVIGSINLNYYRSLFQSVASGQREVSLYLFSGQKVVGEGADALADRTRRSIRDQAWGDYRSAVEERAFLESYRSTSFLPLVMLMRSYDDDALVRWERDAEVVKFVFIILAIALLMMLIMYIVLRAKREKIQGSNYLLSMAIRNTANAIFITDPKGKIEWVNDAFTKLTGYSLKQVRGKTPRILNSGVHERPFFHNLWTTISAGKSWRNELVNRRRDGSLVSVDQTITPILDSKKNVEYFIAVHEDITARKEAEEKVLFLAQHDDLTGLANRRYFEAELAQCVATHQSGSIALIFIDLDRFKEINDTLGHDAGDVLLKRTATKLLRVLPDDAKLSRLGGDEFAVLLYPIHSENAPQRLAQDLVRTLATPFEYQDVSFSVSCSVGVALADIAMTDVSSLLRQADLAMYRAKQSGKNTYRMFDESMDVSMQNRVRMQRLLKDAMQADDQLMLNFQPQIDSQTEQLHGLEVLLRWHCQGEWISPATFIPVAEDSGQIVELGRWVIENTLAQISRWQQKGLSFGRVAINISAVQMANSEVVKDLLDAMKRYDVGSDSIAVEFTESTLMVRSNQLLNNLSRLREAKIAIAIDDFGTGYCSLSYLKELNAQYLKIDKSFIDGIGERYSDECIVTATIAMANGLEMAVVAEGVETEAQVAYLRQHGCETIQGYYYGRPMPAETLESWMQNHAQRITDQYLTR